MARLSHARLDGTDWYWPAGETPRNAAPDDRVRLLAPFDPIVWDRRRFELLWGWAYRFEAYTPVAKRKLGYYAQPLLWKERVVGWANRQRLVRRLPRPEGNRLVRPRGRLLADGARGDDPRRRAGVSHSQSQ